MKAVFFTCVVALVAGQPQYFPYVPPPMQQGICSNYLRKPDALCCLPPQLNRGQGCNAMPFAPPQFRPTPQFLTEVCCESGQRCCMKDANNLRFPAYHCCPEATHTCNVTSGKGECALLSSGSSNTPLFQAELDRYGRCPDGLSPVPLNPNTPLQCSSSSTVNSGWGGSSCPANTYCTKDRNPNQNTGVCCLETHCQQYTECDKCVRVEQHLADHNRPCSWLTQGDGITTAGGRCVASCEGFPQKSCIFPSFDARMCPKSTTWMNGTDYNVGSCDRRCGMVGTGRSSRLNVGVQAYIAQSANATDCCKTQPGDYCCSWDGVLADHCSLGRVSGGPVCGVPISGTPNNFFNTGPGTIPPTQGAWQATQANLYRPRPPMGYPGMGYPMGPRPMGMYGGFGPMFGGGMYNAPMFYRNYGEENQSSDEQLKTVMEEVDKMYMYPAMGLPFYRPQFQPRPPPPPPAPVDQQPTAFVCSCDDDCVDNENADCCSDYFTTCGYGNSASAGLPGSTPSWWIY